LTFFQYCIFVTFFQFRHYIEKTKHSIMKKYHLILFVGVLVYACTTSETAQKETKTKKDIAEQQSAIKPLDFSPKAETYTVSATSSDTIFAPSGSTILFDENSFVDADGKPIKGDVQVEWQEFHTLGDIIASGIPMKYDSAGVAYDLVSGGMFTINASHKGKPAEIAQGKEVEVNLASIQDTPCYNFYELDEETGDWSYQTTKSGEKVPEEGQESEDDLDSSDEPVVTGTIFDMQLNTHQYPELASMEIIGWRAKENVKSEERRWIRNKDTRVRIAGKNPDGSYQLEAKSKKKSHNYDVFPYTEVQAIADSKQNEALLDTQANEIIDYQERLAAGKVIRSISIKGFGTYNWDIINKRENSLPLFAKFQYPKGTNVELVSLYLISPDENAVVRYNAREDRQFSFDPNKRNLLIGIMADNKIVSVSDQGFNSARSKKPSTSHTFNMRKTGIELNSPQDIEKYIEELI